MWYGDHMGWWGWTAMGVGMVVAAAVVIGGIVLLVKVLGSEASPPTYPVPPAPPSPEQILAMRFAHGELTEAEYRERLHVLRNQHPGHLDGR